MLGRFFRRGAEGDGGFLRDLGRVGLSKSGCEIRDK